MILKIRIDDRLLHGQVAYSWKSALGYDAIVIVSDSAAKDEMRKTALKLSRRGKTGDQNGGGGG